MPAIFISYRRSDTGHAADSLGKELTRRFGQDRVFYDEVSIKPGDRFPDVLATSVSTTGVLLVLIGPHWLTECDERGNLRLADEDDWVRREIRWGLDSGARVIPVLCGPRATPVTAAELPVGLEALADLQCLRLEPGNAERDRDEIAKRLVDLVPNLEDGSAERSTKAEKPSRSQVSINNAQGPVHGGQGNIEIGSISMGFDNRGGTGARNDRGAASD